MSAVTLQAMRATPAVDTAASDRWLWLSLGILLALGLVMVYSASVTAPGRGFGASYRHLIHHAMHLVLGLAVMVAVSRTRLVWWQHGGPFLVLLGMVLLVLVLIPGLSGHAGGSARWLALGPVRVQPSEFVKVFLVIYVAGYLTRKREELMYFTQGIFMIGLVVAAFGGLLLLEPDFGSVVVITLTVLLMMFLGGVRFWHFLACVTAGAGVMTALILVAPYRMGRVIGFLDPWADPYGVGFQLVQALIAFGRGGWFGVGLGGSIQKLFYLPAASTDFLLAVIAEELGLFGVLTVIVLFCVILWRAFVIAHRAERLGNVFGARLAQGAGLLLALQATINMGVNMGVLPTKGLTLPFLSYGGSSLVASCLAMGLLLAVDRATRPVAGGRR